MGRLIEGLWDCPYCGTKGIGGSKQYCTNCGRTRGKDTTFYMPGQKRYVEEERARKINRNPDWICGYCDNLNSDNDSSCTSCGATRESESLTYHQNKVKKELISKAKESAKQASRIEKTDYEYEDIRYGETKSQKTYSSGQITNERNKRNINWTPIISVLAIAALLVGLVFLFIPDEREITITQMSWERNISVEEYRTVSESGWALPAGARLIYTNREIHHYEKIIDHYETKYREVAKERYVRTETYVTGYRDLGNGYFEEETATRDIYETYYETESYQEPVYRDEPIYQNKYYYEIDKWVYDRTITSQGKDKNPKWPLVAKDDNEREGARKETYTVIGIDEDDEKHTFTLSYSDWESVNIGQSIVVEISFGHGEIISADENFVIYEAG